MNIKKREPKSCNKVYWETSLSLEKPDYEMVLYGRLLTKKEILVCQLECKKSEAIVLFQVKSIFGFLNLPTKINYIIDYIFNTNSNINKIILFIFEKEKFSRKIVQKTKLKKEVTFFDSLSLYGEIFDYYLYGVLRND